MRLTADQIETLNNEALNGAELYDPALWAEILALESVGPARR
jgi:hypothetical protein